MKDRKVAPAVIAQALQLKTDAEGKPLMRPYAVPIPFLVSYIIYVFVYLVPL